MKFIAISLVIIASAITAPTPASADVVYSNYGPGNATSLSSQTFGNLGGGPIALGQVIQVTGGNYYLDSIDATLQFKGGINLLEMSVFSVSNGLPDVLIDTTQAAGLTDANGAIDPTNFDFQNNVLLENGKSYAIVATPADPVISQFDWRENITGDEDLIFRRITGNFMVDIGETTGAFRINGVFHSIPEPNMIALILVSAAMSCSGVRRRRLNL